MYKNKKILAVISARGGSKGIKKKNLSHLGGKPLISYSIEESKFSKYVDHLIVSTDSEEIKKVSKNFGCEVPFLRPKHLSGDSSKSIDLIRHASKFYKGYFDYIVLLQPTSPFRISKDIDKCIKLCVDRKVSSVTTISENNKNLQWMFYLQKEKLLPVLKLKKMPTRRQDTKKTYTLNGSVYVIDKNFLSKDLVNSDTLGVKIPELRSLDIDEEIDLEFANFLFMKNRVDGRFK
ncbi:MAG: hypothetical protein CMC86_07660 [Flavobacteriaceae bacterium]|nr:hypothetical protein [Flavobacteriaceae bacterium]|tara:strand:- start:2165 stop:2866 length:702 start_codon:yes stop_codon:yes gene_type:complete